jgi:hypothetical protein
VAEITRVINGVEWEVSKGGQVRRAGFIVIDCDGEVMSRKVEDVRMGIVLFDEWQTLHEREQAEREPSVKLPDGYNWARGADGGWWAHNRHRRIGPAPENEDVHFAVIQGRREVRARNQPKAAAAATEYSANDIAQTERLIERYQKCSLAIWSMFTSDPLGDDPAHFWVERLESLIKRGLIGPKEAEPVCECYRETLEPHSRECPARAEATEKRSNRR